MEYCVGVSELVATSLRKRSCISCNLRTCHFRRRFAFRICCVSAYTPKFCKSSGGTPWLNRLVIVATGNEGVDKRSGSPAARMQNLITQSLSPAVGERSVIRHPSPIGYLEELAKYSRHRIWKILIAMGKVLSQNFRRSKR